MPRNVLFAQEYRYHTRLFLPRRPSMAGHSKWANIQRRESVQLRRRDRAAAAPGHADLQRVRYEGYGPGGAAVMVECLTDDRGRVAARLRRAFAEHGGNLGADGSVSYLFNTVGLMTYPPGTDEEALMRVALEAGAEDVVPSATARSKFWPIRSSSTPCARCSRTRLCARDAPRSRSARPPPWS